MILAVPGDVELAGMDQRLTLLEEALDCPGHVAFAGPSPTDVVLMGSRAGRAEAKAFANEDGQAMLAALGEAGLKIPSDEIGLMYAVSCDSVTCAAGRRAVLGLFAPQWVLVVGEESLRALRSDLKLSPAQGMPFHHPDAPGAVFFPVYSPASLAKKSPTMRQAWIENLKAFVALTEGEDLFPFVSDHCGRCGLDAIYWEDTMVPWGQCQSSECGLPAGIKARLAALLSEDGLPCREAGCVAPATRHPLSFPTGSAPEQMTWGSLSNADRILAEAIFTGGNRGVSEAALLQVRGRKASKVALLADLQRLETLGWILAPSVDRETWVLSPRGRKVMDSQGESP